VSADGLTYDTGALVAAERDDRLLWSLHRAALVRQLTPVVPAGVLGEVWRGGPQHRLSRLLKGCDVEPLTEHQARAIGVLAGRSRLSDTVDLAVAEGAIRRNHAVVTSNRKYIEQVANSVNRQLTIHDV
jgi:predicted nucleic acid-binding protein